jgi:hypothetical protein
MVDTTNLSRINQLYMELNAITQARELLDDGGRIISLTVGKQSDSEPPFWQFTSALNTEYMQYPQMMVEAIKAFMVGREQDIESELSDLGVTVAEGTARAAPAAPPKPTAPAAPARAPKPTPRTPTSTRPRR